MLSSFEPLRASSRLWNSRPSSRRAPVATMSLLSSRASRLSGPSSCLCALLALLLLTPPAPLASGESARHAGRTREARRPGHGDQLSRATGALTRSLSSAAGPVAAVVRELRCVCLSTTAIHPKMIARLQVIAAGPQCSKVEVV